MSGLRVPLPAQSTCVRLAVLITIPAAPVPGGVAPVSPGAARVRSAPDSPARHRARRVSGPVVPGLLGILFAAQTIMPMALAGWRMRGIVMATLRPVRRICDRLDEINEGHPEARIPEFPGRQEINRLARGINSALERGWKAHRFASDVSHELRSPLTALRVQIEEARLHGGQTDLDDLLRRVLREADHLESIIDDLLTLSRAEQGGESAACRPLDMAAVVRQHVARRHDRVPAGLRLESGVFVNGVEPQISRILTNLLDNGQRHVKGSITVGVRRDGDIAEMTVEDDGDGVPPAEREHIFERFARSEKSRRVDPRGAGLGLAITREIAHAHGGTIHVEDSAAGGARFVLRLPAVDPSGEIGETRSVRSCPPATA
ncbi:HAMP domain-containing sensor histidine kinase [Streptosporangium sp. NPDC049248]|uniref:HAMP domain-containing sensor histidine kinase n=1 Tax=Streptosporangium sp. NPDC049248 TaxID=3155651 RepID=UPI00342239D2